jgi:hypothetical protein
MYVNNEVELNEAQTEIYDLATHLFHFGIGVGLYYANDMDLTTDIKTKTESGQITEVEEYINNLTNHIVNQALDNGDLYKRLQTYMIGLEEPKGDI